MGPVYILVSTFSIDVHGEGSVRTGAWGLEHGDWSMGMGAWGQECGDGSVVMMVVHGYGSMETTVVHGDRCVGIEHRDRSMVMIVTWGWEHGDDGSV